LFNREKKENGKEKSQDTEHRLTKRVRGVGDKSTVNRKQILAKIDRKLIGAKQGTGKLVGVT